jgi:hypothetical protein
LENAGLSAHGWHVDPWMIVLLGLSALFVRGRQA